MEIKGYKVELVAIVLIICLGLFFGGNYYYKNYRLENSLIEKLAAIEGVEKVEIEDSNQIKEVELNLKQVDDLKEVYQEVDRTLANSFDDTKYRIRLNNSENEKLNFAYHRIHLSIYESIITGKFTSLTGQLDKLKNELDINEAEISVDRNNIYLKLQVDQDAFYKVIARNHPLQEANFQGGGANG